MPLHSRSSTSAGGHRDAFPLSTTFLFALAGGAAGVYPTDRQAAELKQNIPGATVERVGEGIPVTFASGLLYDFDSDVVKPTARSTWRSMPVRSCGRRPELR